MSCSSHHFSSAISHKESSVDNGKVSTLLAQTFIVCQDPSVSGAAIVNSGCCISQCIDSFKCLC